MIGSRNRKSTVGRSEIVRIAFFALLLGVIAAGITALTGHDGVMARYQGGIAAISCRLINIFGGRAAVQGNVIHSSGSFALSVVTACTGLFITGVFIVAVLAFPATFLAKLLGVFSGAAAIFLINIVRLGSLFYVGVHFPDLFEQMHLLIWQSLIIVFALFLWLLWVRMAAHAR